MGDADCMEVRESVVSRAINKFPKWFEGGPLLGGVDAREGSSFTHHPAQGLGPGAGMVALPSLLC